MQGFSDDRMQSLHIGTHLDRDDSFLLRAHGPTYEVLPCAELIWN